MKNPSTPERFFSYRTFLGAITGLVVALDYILIFHRPGQLTPLLSIIFAWLVSRLSAPKHLAGLGILIGIPTGYVVGLQAALYNPEPYQRFGGMILAGLLSCLWMTIYAAEYALAAFVFAQLVRLYKKHAIF